MDWTLFFYIMGFGIVLLSLVVWMLNRAWGDFDQHGPRVEDVERQAHQASSWGEPLLDAPTEPHLPAGAPDEDLIPVSHPLLKQAIRRALANGGTPASTYFVREDDEIYLAAYRIADPEQREQVTRLFRSLGDAGDQASVFELLQAIKHLGR
ncbi:hypothetical protein [Candidatus Viridilinea mediisalina]|uniref:Uncharacterized protein n=1 Tax=Candidatus Viridilinea mediisalina TaxID=2024553 RepID=A0A2A6RPK4_9CHLR|nr:hypothetical protein [Candidatus Viridilinea mediisalina]PDW04982.1 hypothetical protein CJ255_00975 [Candidatus Viridilinea mediisalina]